jgi:hypothetical protein
VAGRMDRTLHLRDPEDREQQRMRVRSDRSAHGGRYSGLSTALGSKDSSASGGSPANRRSRAPGAVT